MLVNGGTWNRFLYSQENKKNKQTNTKKPFKRTQPTLE